MAALSRRSAFSGVATSRWAVAASTAPPRLTVRTSVERTRWARLVRSAKRAAISAASVSRSAVTT